MLLRSPFVYCMVLDLVDLAALVPLALQADINVNGSCVYAEISTVQMTVPVKGCNVPSCVGKTGPRCFPLFRETDSIRTSR